MTDSSEEARGRRSPMGRVIGALVPRAVDAIDPDDLLERIDLDAVLARIDLQQVIERIDLDPVLARVDVDAIVQRVDIGSIVDRVDVDAVINRLDLDELMGRVDVHALVERVDLDALLARVDIASLMGRAGIDQIVRDATSGIAVRTLDLGRRQVLGVDAVALGVVDRTLGRRKPGKVPVDTSPAAACGRRAGGPLARLLGFLVDSVTVSASFGVLVALGATLTGLFTGRSVNVARSGGPEWLLAFTAWWFTYLWVAVSIAGRTVGKALIGLRVVAVDGSRLRPARAALRAVVFPLSLVFGLGFLPAVVGRGRRALHDLAAGSMVVVDWGGREVALPGVLAEWIADREVGTTG